MASSSLSHLCSCTSSLHHPLSHSISANLTSKTNLSFQFLANRQSPLLSSTPRSLTVIAGATAPSKLRGKTKKVVGIVKMNVWAGKATLAPPDQSFTFILKTPPTSFLLLKAAGVKKGSKDPKQIKVGMITIDQVRKIAEVKLPELNCTTIVSTMRTIAGTAGNMGIDIDPPILEPKNKVALL
ncbi:putative ribosomal protein L11/L12 [Arabidopsis thaliana]|uniref:Large ribosomal subunit protein uL11 C-terminal domain-containing protein n=3 Tax=Arabidopsis TaxID=3701 RepID=A0A178UAU2_ARATH|nr:Ribosomal protein L11 family protein [Arabidopsis thaliana]KAG7605714.1 Ribosomal protein L11/L12 [Arabidopsis thaliana x Arabidopsis arenosa]AED96103.1 Ribosomal protein L11 family protein [Arabidopsis thaliana]OAO90759.1 hypothetical protein AXX17_AT5G50430 [Arabidopsis thaliana]CAA0409135.1 unnamed protein product [Arabidopsis thaliana]VYS70023.1 unnamed protein product [Arabidopsis thaliana]|eukprot:NP_199974.1 Ribosomal protein L11 family protein [Arabidopsis thaliana]